MARVDPKQRKAHIINCARHVFSQIGYEQATVMDILRVADISKGAFYHYFDSKESLLDEIIEDALQPILFQAQRQDTPYALLSCLQDGYELSLNDHGNVLLHHKFFLSLLHALTPPLSVLLAQENIPNPTSMAEVLLCAARVLFDPSLASPFTHPQEDRNKALQILIESLLMNKTPPCVQHS